MPTEQRQALLLPFAGHHLGQIFELQALRLASVENGFNDVGRQQRQAEQAVDEAAGVPSASASSPAERYLHSSSIRFHRSPAQRADQRLVWAWFRRGPCVAAIGRDHRCRTADAPLSFRPLFVRVAAPQASACVVDVKVIRRGAWRNDAQ